ncbi:hypothetical protein AAWM_03690 [Aspergillus awamori]|uniref:Aminoglycoside phosphotransferase domain-containing protein n=1 Tax=Aspergillus awamori TaxID=105351 RepID=A0A401KNF3_ASPAW|nr:hypothetical protein AAWM_03690 [Aspergillus awamori]
MWEPVALPFQSSHPLPTPLPTIDEIRACTNVLWEARASKVVAVNDNIVVKYGVRVETWEGQALIYLEQCVPEVPAPRLYAMHCESDERFLVMQRIHGVPLNSLWSSLAPSEKDDIITKLQQAWMGVLYPTTYSIANVAMIMRDFSGLFSNESALVAGLVGNYRALVEKNKHPDYKARFYEKYLPRVLQGHRPTLTHGDIQQKNIMVVENFQNNQDRRSLVDWENAGWFPDFWEGFCASCPLHFYRDEDWSWRVQEFIQFWPAEMSMMHLIERDLGW